MHPCTVILKTNIEHPSPNKLIICQRNREARVKRSSNQNCASSWTAISAHPPRTSIETLRFSISVASRFDARRESHSGKHATNELQDREQPHTDWRRVVDVVLRLIRAGSCGEATARTPIIVIVLRDRTPRARIQELTRNPLTRPKEAQAVSGNTKEPASALYF